MDAKGAAVEHLEGVKSLVKVLLMCRQVFYVSILQPIKIFVKLHQLRASGRLKRLLRTMSSICAQEERH